MRLKITLLGFLFGLAGNCAETNATLSEARSRFTSSLVKKSASPQDFEPALPPAGVREVLYFSGRLKLKAWVSENSGAEKRCPAVLFLHGGFAFGASDWRDAALFQKAGFVVMVPMLRGENGNAGNFEMFFGEVDDAIAAGRFLKALPYVDSTNVFVAGHSVGGTLTQLVSMTSDDFRGAASFSGAPNQKTFCEAFLNLVPFDMETTEEIRLRSPLEFPGSVRCPLFLYAGKEESIFVQQNRLLASKTQKLGKPAYFTEFPGDHFSALPLEIADSISQFSLLMKKPSSGPVLPK